MAGVVSAPWTIASDPGWPVVLARLFRADARLHVHFRGRTDGPRHEPGSLGRLPGERGAHKLDGCRWIVDFNDNARVVLIIQADRQRLARIVNIPEGPLAGARSCRP